GSARGDPDGCGMRSLAYQVVVVADDLTGSNDTGVQIVKRGLEAITAVDLALARDALADGIVLDTESRSLSAENARAAVREAARAVGSGTGALIYKKIDSTLRGHVGAELDALAGELGPDRVVCVPAFPRSGRTTRNGIHFLHGIPIDRTEMAADPRNPVETASLLAVLARDGGPRFRHTELDALRSGRIEHRPADRFLSFDCEEQEDLRRVVRAFRGSGERILWCGSAGLAEALLSERFPAAAEAGDRHANGSAPDVLTGGKGNGPVFSVIGSGSGVSRRQLERALASGEAHVVRLRPQALLDSAARERERIVRELEIGKTVSGHLVLTPLGLGAGGLVTSVKTGPHPRDAFPELLATFLADVSAEFLRRNRVAGLFLTGGDTAIHVLRAIGARGLRLEAELETGVVRTRLIGGAFEGVPVVTKAGGFGDDGTLVRSARLLAAQFRGR
ncbi:MAG: four-carbon acid sugar kinase family protein, partial [Verrucomicrobiota bacterium]